MSPRILAWSVLPLALVACQPLSTPTPVFFSESLPVETPISPPSTVSANTSVGPTATAILITPEVTATPIYEFIGSKDDLERLVRNLYTWWSPCIGQNFAEISPETPLSYSIEFVEVAVQPNPQEYWISEIADNIDKSLQAFVACDPEFCQDKIYVLDIETKKVYEIKWETQFPWRPIESVIWINENILAFYQSINPQRAQIVVVDIDERKYLYHAFVFPDYFCSTITPTP